MIFSKKRAQIIWQTRLIGDCLQANLSGISDITLIYLIGAINGQLRESLRPTEEILMDEINQSCGARQQ